MTFMFYMHLSVDLNNMNEIVKFYENTKFYFSSSCAKGKFAIVSMTILLIRTVKQMRCGKKSRKGRS